MANLRLPRWHLLSLAVVLAVIYLPLASMVQFSFNDSKRAAIWRGFSLRHYEAALSDSDLLAAFGNSLLVASINALLATLIGLAAALGLERFRFPGSAAYLPVMALPLAVPEICLGLAMLIFFHLLGWPSNLDWPLSLLTVLIAHVTFSWPFAALVLRARLRQLDPALELAGSDLGADKWQVLFRITIPQLRPALIASMLLAFTLSLDDFVITFFTSSPSAQLLPVKVFSMVRVGSTPTVNAVSTVLVAVTFAGIGLAAWVMRKK